jgi:PII-like signaling protein
MSTDVLRLTAYLGERKRVAGQFAADALLDCYEDHEVATSILLRGMAGFGHKHHLRTDTSLSLSEDLPAVAIAVDVAERIEAVLDHTARIVGDGLVTVERAGLPSGRTAAAKLTVHLGRQDRIDGRPAFVAVCELLQHQGIDGASALLGVDGTVRRQRQRARFFARNAAVPVLVVAVGAADRIAGALPAIRTVLPEALCTVQPVEICPPVASLDSSGGQWQKLTVFTAESQLHAGRPIHREIVRRLRSSGASGATTLRGIWGFHGNHPPHGDRLFQLGRNVPALTTVIDTTDRIGQAYAVIAELTAEHGVVTSEPLLRLLRTPVSAARPPAAR